MYSVHRLPREAGNKFLDNPLLRTASSNGAALLPGFLLALPFMCVDYMCVCVFQAIGDGKKSFYLAFLRKIMLEIPALVLNPQ